MTSTHITVKMTRMDRRTFGGKIYKEDCRVRTRQGTKTMKMVGECMAEGGTVSARTWYDDKGDEWMEVHMDWSPEAEA